MSEQTLVDPEKVVRGGEVLTGRVSVTDLPEIADRVADQAGTLEWKMRGERDLFGRARLHLQLDGQLVLICQRCLGPLLHALRHERDLVVVREEVDMPELEEEEEDADCILVPGLLDVTAVVLEELLLALPMMPRHEQSDCHGPEEAGEGDRVSPFAVLRQPGGN
jgi:uncharacterized protein